MVFKAKSMAKATGRSDQHLGPVSSGSPEGVKRQGRAGNGQRHLAPVVQGAVQLYLCPELP